MTRRMMALALGGVLLVTAACGREGSAIQKQYSADYDECRDYAEQTSGHAGGGTPGGMATGQEQIVLISQFARCMNKRGWSVNKPPEDVTKEAQRATGRGR